VCCSYLSTDGYSLRRVEASRTGSTLRIANRASDSRGEGRGGSFQSDVLVERITVLGVASEPRQVAIVDGALYVNLL